MKLFGSTNSDKPVVETEMQEFSSSSASTPVLPVCFDPNDPTTWQVGPREKNQATVELEQVLRKLASTKVGNATMTHGVGGDWFLQLCDKDGQVETTNISVLIRHATLLHVRLSHGTQVGLRLHFPNWAKHQPDDAAFQGTVFSLMMPFQRAAIYTYTQNHYKEINAFFRGNYTFPAGGLAPLTSLVVWAIMDQAKKEIPYLVSNNPQFKKDLITGDLYRAEIFTPQETAHLRRGVVPTGHILSVSTNSVGRGNLHIAGDMPWTVSMRPVSAFASEDEVQADGQLHCVAGPGKTVARYVNSFQHDKPSRLVSAKALSHVHQHFLTKRYRDGADTINIGGTLIERPVHNITMTGSTLSYLLPVIDLLTKHSVSPDVAATLGNLTNRDIEFLRLLIIFDVSGRNSEANFAQQPDLCRQYRIDSGDHFAEYAARETDYSAEEIALGRKLIIQRTVPHCDLMTHPYWVVISMIHVLDLIRCWDNAKYQKTLDEYRLHLNMDVAADADWLAVVDFAEVCVEGFDNHRTARGKIGRGSVFKLFSTWVHGVDEVVAQAPTRVPTAADCQHMRDVFASFAGPKHAARKAVPAAGSSGNLFIDLKQYFKSEKEFLNTVDYKSDLFGQYSYEKNLSSLNNINLKTNYDDLFKSSHFMPKFDYKYQMNKDLLKLHFPDSPKLFDLLPLINKEVKYELFEKKINIEPLYFKNIANDFLKKSLLFKPLETESVFEKMQQLVALDPSQAKIEWDRYVANRKRKYLQDKAPQSNDDDNDNDVDDKNQDDDDNANDINEKLPAKKPTTNAISNDDDDDNDNENYSKRIGLSL